MSAAVAEPEPEIVEADSAPEGNASRSGNVSAAVAYLSSARSSSTGAVAKTEVATTAAIEPKDEKEEKVNVTAGAKDSETKAEAKAEAIVSAAPQSAAKSSASEQKGEQKSEQKSATKPGQKSHGRMVTLVALLVTCGAFYAAWVYEPGFQALAKSQINHFLVLVGMAPQPQPAAPAPVQTRRSNRQTKRRSSSPDQHSRCCPAVTTGGRRLECRAGRDFFTGDLFTAQLRRRHRRPYLATSSRNNWYAAGAVRGRAIYFGCGGSGQPASSAANTAASSPASLESIFRLPRLRSQRRKTLKHARRRPRRHRLRTNSLPE